MNIERRMAVALWSDSPLLSVVPYIEKGKTNAHLPLGCIMLRIYRIV
jgi:hypothetical protein